jgi:hypothetical protein
MSPEQVAEKQEGIAAATWRGTRMFCTHCAAVLDPAPRVDAIKAARAHAMVCPEGPVKRLREALQEIRDMHDGEEDVIDDERGPKPNRAMRVNQIIDAVL